MNNLLGESFANRLIKDEMLPSWDHDSVAQQNTFRLHQNVEPIRSHVLDIEESLEND